MKTGPKPFTPAQRLVAFWAKVKVIGECWIWQAGKNRDGYGVFGIGGHKYVLAHHFLIGRPPKGWEWDHTCNNPACIRPKHLDLVTHPINVSRAAARITHCRQGHVYSEANTWRDKEGKRHCRACWKLKRQRPKLMPELPPAGPSTGAGLIAGLAPVG